MSLIINNVISSNIDIQYSYLDTDEIFGYVVTANYKINISDIQFDVGDGILLLGRSAIRSAYERQNIVARIGGDEFNNGLITNLSFEENTLVGSEVASITVVERKRLNDYTSKSFAKYMPSPHLVESFEENYDFSRSENNYTYNRNISIKYAQDAGDQFLHNAKIFLTNYYHENRPSLGYYEDGISENAKFDEKFNGKLTENIDLIGLSVSLSESFNSSIIDSGKNVSTNITEKLSQDSAGYVSKVITIELTALRYDAQNVIESAIADIIDEVISAQQSQFGKPHSIEKGITKDSNKASITISFSTNPNLSQQNTIIYTCSKQKAGSFFEYTLSVKYKASGKNISQRYDNTVALWKSSNSQNEAKVVSLFAEASGLIYESSRNSSISRSDGEITDNITFSTNTTYNTADLPDGIIKYDITISKTNKVKRHEKILDITSLTEKIATNNLDTLGQATVTATTIAEQSYGLYHGKNFLNTKTSEMNDALNEGTYYGVSDQTTIDLANGTTTRVISYIIA